MRGEFHTGRHDGGRGGANEGVCNLRRLARYRRRVARVRSGVRVWSVSRHIQGVLLFVLFDGKLAFELAIHHLHTHVHGLGHAGIAKSVKDVDIGHGHRLGGVLQHWVRETRKHLANLAHEKGKEAIVAVSGGCNDGNDLAEVLLRPNRKGVARRWLHRQVLGHRIGALDELLEQSRVEQLHTLPRELRGHVHKHFSRYVSGDLEGHGSFGSDSSAVGQLPYSVLEPLLVSAEVVPGGVMEGGLNSIAQLLLQATDVLRGEEASGLVPGVCEGIIKRPEEIDEQDEAVELMG